MGHSPLVQLVRVSKTFKENSVQACSEVSLDLWPGEIHGLIGENGAGKSTLMKILCGATQPDSGTLVFEGRPLDWGNVSAWTAGIAMVSQQPLPVRGLNLSQLFLIEDSHHENFKPVSKKKLLDQCRQLSEAQGWNLNWDQPSETLPWTELQKARLLFLTQSNKKVIILDEPTTSLPPGEARLFLDLMKEWASQGRAVVFITHRLSEVAQCAHRVTLMHSGRVQKTWDRGSFNLEDLQVAFSPQSTSPRMSTPSNPGKVIWSMESLKSNRGGVPVLRDFSLELRSGEILGLAALQGPGLQALEDLLTGQVAPQSGRMVLDGRPLNRFTPKAFREAGLGWVTADRVEEGSVGEASVLENIMPLRLKDLSPGCVISRQKSLGLWDRIQKLFSLPPGPHQKVNQLSGGNLQRVMVAREWEASPRVMILSEPSWGLDALSRKSLGERARDLVQSGGAVLVISSDAGELLELCDRVGVLSDGVLAGDRPSAQWDPLEISKLLTGAD